MPSDSQYVRVRLFWGHGGNTVSSNLIFTIFQDLPYIVLSKNTGLFKEKLMPDKYRQII